jgi:RNA polymerase sigma-70 factor (ECF subfamily)
VGRWDQLCAAILWRNGRVECSFLVYTISKKCSRQVWGMLNISELDDFELLVRTHRARLLRLVAFSTGDQDLAETVVQDSLLKAYNARDNFRGDCSVGTWLRTITLNVMRDYQRRQKFQFWKKASLTGVSVSDAAISLASGDPSPETRMLAREQVQQVELALKSLSERQRSVFIMRFLDEMELEEISVATGLPPPTVKTHLYRAIKAVRFRLGGTR